MSSIHLHEELTQTEARVVVETRFGPVTGGRTENGAVVFLGKPTDTNPIPCPILPKTIWVARTTLRSYAGKI
jgi:hypothetical protein